MPQYRLADELPDTSDLKKKLLHHRGHTTPAEQQRFLSPNYDTDRHDPFLLHNMELATARILQAIKDGEKITIFSDYDCDGIPGAVVLHDFFQAILFTNFDNYIPHRHYEGFGLSTEAVEKLAASGTKLIITIDCGTSDIEAVARASEFGIDVIITDHHEPKEELPPAVAVVNPKIGDTYPFKELCGAGVVYKLIEALLERGEFKLTSGFEKWWLDMVGVATVADMVPLVGENRVFARYGLEVLRKSRRPGLHQLLRKNRLDQRRLTEDDVGFTLGPRINAASRMDDPEDAFRMLATNDETEAGGRVEHLERLNSERKGLVAAMTKELKKRVDGMSELPSVIVLGNPAWRPSLVGLSASSLAGEFGRPVFLWGRDGNGVIKGSCRSEGKTSVITLMDTVGDSFIEHGGHHMSGGFSVHEEQLFSLPQRLNAAFAELGNEAQYDEEVVVDAALSLDAIGPELLTTLKELAPFGVGNEKPLFAFVDVVPAEVAMFGKTKEHVKLVLPRLRDRLEAIAFFKTPNAFSYQPKVGEPITILAHVEESYFMNRHQVRLRIVDVLRNL
ncbi:single-stranded-DNA-specific exonuclease RecJ [Candidatus Kaiserbacteria bacterium]|nr:single-stranded-DNA-specific exonuclease RecJ [Candidatus Kaiserbacteria bacterium]MCB9811444.1 single-stranded-DNA-specific exonuclease RecJ [Candidatus Nomurabacteria bacterium]